LAYRRVGGEPDAPIEIMLVTSRQTRRWIIPKGNVDHGMSPHAAAAQEAEEEAGVRGTISHDPIGTFTYSKQIVSGLCINAKVVVFPLGVHEVMDEWKESKWRRRRWFAIDEVTAAIQEAGLRKIINSFATAGRGKAR
jgi:8-oxo-dGTP pyrophosphatase MutT (NUDIX family)